jgi:hypothetical protein
MENEKEPRVSDSVRLERAESCVKVRLDRSPLPSFYTQKVRGEYKMPVDSGTPQRDSHMP